MTKTFGPNEPPYTTLRSAKRDDACKRATLATPRPQFLLIKRADVFSFKWNIPSENLILRLDIFLTWTLFALSLFVGCRDANIPESQTSDTLVTSVNVSGDPPHSGSSAIQELTAAFSEPSSTKVISSSSPYKVPTDLYTALFTCFKAAKVEEEMVKAAGNVRPLPINSDLWKAVEIFYESSVVTWHLRLHVTLLSKYLHSKCGQDPVLKVVCKKIHGAIRESRQPWLVVRLWPLRLNVTWLLMHRLFGIAGTFVPRSWLTH